MKKLSNKSIIILGGGTAGWMAATLMAKKWDKYKVKITVIESPAIGVVGVGEGSTPLMKTFFDYLDIPESEWMPECNATYKVGIRFNDWSTKAGFESYFHPFSTNLDDHTLPAFQYNTEMRRRGVKIDAHPDRYFLTTKLAEQRLAPIPHYNFPFGVGYGYHFDSVLLGNFLAKKARESGVEHKQSKIVDVNLNQEGEIQSLVSETEECIEGDLFIDCTGFASVLMQKVLKVPFVSFEDNLFNDRAVAMPSEIGEEIPSETVSTALKYGWAWKIPLTNRFGNGYVYSSKYCSEEEAEQELREHLGLENADVEARHLKMNVGRLEKNWHKNCVAIGLSQGFIEPLEATALHFIQSSIQKFMDAYEFGGFTEKNQENYNKDIVTNFERIRDYIVLHYNTNSRDDTQYWKDNQENENLSSSLESMIDCWMSAGDLTTELEKQGIGKYYQPISWYSIFAGMGIFPKPETLQRGKPAAYKYNLEYIDDFLERCKLNFDEQAIVLKRNKKAAS